MTNTPETQLAEVGRRVAYSRRKWKTIEVNATGTWKRLDNSQTHQVPGISQRACIYVTGSFAREEASEGSDLDLFVMDDLPDGDSVEGDSLGSLTYVESARLISALDEVRLASGIRPFSRGGEFITTHSFQKLLREIGSPQDDATNAFTARVLLLVNSKPLLNEKAYHLARRHVLDSYWDRHDRDHPFFPIMLTNDLRRWWGVLCLNFERDNRRRSTTNFESTPERRLQNLKLRYTKLTGVYSSLLGLVDKSTKYGILREEAEQVFDAYPVDRLLQVAANHSGNDSRIAKLVQEVLTSYDEYLTFAARDKTDLLAALSDEDVWKERRSRAYNFHEVFVRLFSATGKEGTLYEYCVM